TSCQLQNKTVDNIVLSCDYTHGENKDFNIKIGEGQFSLGKNDGINQALDCLCKNDWVNSSDNYQDTNLHKLLSSLAETSLAERMIGFNNALKCDLPADYHPTFCFEGNGQSGVNMHYEVIHSENNCNHFKLTGAFLFDKNCQLRDENPLISIEYFPQCSKALEETLDSRTVMQALLDWLRNLFHLNGSALANIQSEVDITEYVEVSFLNKNQVGIADGIMENRVNEERAARVAREEQADDIKPLLRSIIQDFDVVIEYINNELGERSDDGLEQMLEKFSDGIDKD
ncbi:hypothetical protein V2A85_24030, partial [Yersinia sp. 1252 StPb PI]|uniref:hypothetical protein n=1 Tax=Yersinia sp. 1252 StPb PI TaxID=3117404 RepID=UPI003B27C91F